MSLINWKGKRFTRIKIEDAVSPGDSSETIEVYRDWWWVVTPADEILLFDGRSVQANFDERIGRMLIKKYDGCRLRQLSMVILPHKEPA